MIGEVLLSPMIKLKFITPKRVILKIVNLGFLIQKGISFAPYLLCSEMSFFSNGKTILGIIVDSTKISTCKFTLPP